MSSPYANRTDAGMFQTAESASTVDITTADQPLDSPWPRALSIGNTGSAAVAVDIRPGGASDDVTWVCAGGAETYIPVVVSHIRQNASTALQVKRID